MQCNACEECIDDADSYWSVNTSLERSDGDTIQVLEAEQRLVFCASCASELDFDRIEVPTKLYCSECNHPIDVEDLFCGNCGIEFAAEDEGE